MRECGILCVAIFCSIRGSEGGGGVDFNKINTTGIQVERIDILLHKATSRCEKANASTRASGVCLIYK